MTLKNLLFEVLEEALMPIRERREKNKNLNLQEILFESTKKAIKTADATLDKVRNAMFLYKI
jgi:hypothetical protein